VARRGYWGDIMNSPFLAYGIESEEPQMYKKAQQGYQRV
jgi:hypothetical protein